MVTEGPVCHRDICAQRLAKLVKVALVVISRFLGQICRTVPQNGMPVVEKGIADEQYFLSVQLFLSGIGRGRFCGGLGVAVGAGTAEAAEDTHKDEYQRQNSFKLHNRFSFLCCFFRVYPVYNLIVIP